MPVNTLDTDQLDALLRQNDEAQLLDVLPPEHYKKVRLPGSTNLPLKHLEDQATQELNKSQPVVVYCSGADCGMSLKAARILDDLGFEEVYDFEAGIAGWLRDGRDVVRGVNTERN